MGEQAGFDLPSVITSYSIHYTKLYEMEIPVVAPSGGKVKEVKVAVGQSVEAGEELAEIE